jgi:hypothetical protein
MVLGGGGVWGESLEPNFVVMLQAFLLIVDENGGRDVHRVDKAKPLLDAALADEVLHGGGDVHEAAAAGDFKPQLFGQAFHRL